MNGATAKRNRIWWAIFLTWLLAAIGAVAYPLTKPRDLGTFFEIIWLSLLASVFAFSLLIYTLFNWRSLRLLHRCLGMLPLSYLLLPLLFFRN